MPDNSPRPSGRQRALIAPLVILIVLAAIVVVALVTNASHREKPAPEAPPQVPAPPAVSLDVPAPPLTRADIVQDANAAAAAYAVGARQTLSRSALIGRRFVVRIPFGCNGPGAP